MVSCLYFLCTTLRKKCVIFGCTHNPSLLIPRMKLMLKEKNRLQWLASMEAIMLSMAVEHIFLPFRLGYLNCNLSSVFLFFWADNYLASEVVSYRWYYN